MDFLGQQERQQLLQELTRLQIELARLNEREPEQLGSDSHEAWAEAHEELEDQMDEIMDLLEG